MPFDVVECHWALLDATKSLRNEHGVFITCRIIMLERFEDALGDLYTKNGVVLPKIFI